MTFVSPEAPALSPRVAQRDSSVQTPLIRPAALPAYVERIDRSLVANEFNEVQCLALQLSDGRELGLYQFGVQRETVVLLPPYGMTFVLVARLARLLAARFRVIVWESIGSPDPSVEMSESDTTLVSQASVFARVIEALGLTDVHFVGWCQAAQIAAYALANDFVNLKTMSWIAPAGFGYSLVVSEFDRCALPIYLEIEKKQQSHAKKLGTILDKYANSPFTVENAAEKLTMLHLVDPRATCVFSRYMKAYADNKAIAKLALPVAVSRVPTFALHARDDTFSHFSESVQLAKRHESVKLELFDSGGHLQVFNDPGILAPHLFDFIDSSRSSSTTSV